LTSTRESTGMRPGRLVVLAMVTMTLAACTSSMASRPTSRTASSSGRHSDLLSATTVPTVPYLGPCPLQPVSLPATHVPASGLVEVDVGTHQRFHPIRVVPLDNPQAAIFAGGDLYVSYSPSGPESGFRVERIDPKTGVLARSQWFLGYSSPPVAAFGSIWVVAGTGLCPRQVIRLNQETLAVTMRTQIRNFSAYLVADDGALWLLGQGSARLARLNPRTGRISTVLLPEMAPDSQVVWFASDPESGLLYISVINQNVAHSQVTERFDPTTGSFFVVPTPPFELTSVLGVAGDILWVIQGGGMMTHFAPFSTASLAPLSCTRAVTCALAGSNGAVDGSVENGIFAFEHIGGPEGRHGSLLLDCIGGPRVSTVARLQLPSDFPIPGGSSLPPILLALGDGYLATLARVGTDGGSGVAIFPLDPRCAP
jgi:hypothetical protein